MENKKSIYNRAIKQARVYLDKESIVEFRHYRIIWQFAKLRYGIDLAGKKEAREWLIAISVAGDLKGWPVCTEKTKAWKARKRAKKKNKLPNKYEAFLLTPYWRSVRKKILDRDNHRCQMCGSENLLHVHHVTYIHHFSEMDHLEDLITLCKKCHKEVHRK